MNGVSTVSAQALVGSWQLVDFLISFSGDRSPVRPMGEGARGLVTYGADGWMSAVLSRGDRAAVGTASLEAYQGVADPAKVAAFDSYLSYAGCWSVETSPDGVSEVVHQVDLALVPELVGQSLRRRVALQGEGAGARLTLSYTVQPPGRSPRLYTLHWRRP